MLLSAPSVLAPVPHTGTGAVYSSIAQTLRRARKEQVAAPANGHEELQGRARKDSRRRHVGRRELVVGHAGGAGVQIYDVSLLPA